MDERSIKILKNSSNTLESLMSQKSDFIKENLSDRLFYSSLVEQDVKELQQLEKMVSKIEGMQPRKGQAKAASAIRVLHIMRKAIEAERKAIKFQVAEHSIVFSYDAILKNCNMHIKRLIFSLSYYV